MQAFYGSNRVSGQKLREIKDKNLPLAFAGSDNGSEEKNAPRNSPPRDLKATQTGKVSAVFFSLLALTISLDNCWRFARQKKDDKHIFRESQSLCHGLSNRDHRKPVRTMRTKGATLGLNKPPRPKARPATLMIRLQRRRFRFPPRGRTRAKI